MSILNSFFIDPPSNRDDFVEKMAFNIYASRQSRIDQLIDELAVAADPNDEWTQTVAFTHAGFINADDLLPDEREYVEKEIASRWSGNF